MGMIPCYSLKDVLVGSEMVSARPVGWDKVDYDGFGHDKDGEDVQAIEWASTCPSCGDLLQFIVTDIFKLNDNYCVECKECGAGKRPEGLDISNPIDPEKMLENYVDVSFVDPIKSGTFDIEIDKDRLLRLAEPA